MNLRDLTYVLAVAKHKNFTRAADAARVSQPALSNQIKKLEAELGLPIFERARDGVLLTAFGQDFLTHAQQVVDLVDDMTNLANTHKTHHSEPLRLGITPTLAAYLSRYFRTLFEETISNRHVVIVEGYPVEMSKMVEDRDIDMAFIAKNSFETIYKGSVRPMDFSSLWLEPLYLAVRTGHPLTQRKSIWAHDVPAEHLIRFDISFGYDLEQNLPPMSQAAAQQTGIDVKSARFETVCRHVAQSDACTIVNAIAAEQFKRDGFGLSFIPFDDPGNLRELGVLTRPNYPNPEVIETLRAHVGLNPPHGTIASQVAHPLTTKQPAT